jgi:hypothetical protein
MNIVIWVTIVAVIGVSLLAAATYLIDRDADRRDHHEG